MKLFLMILLFISPKMLLADNYSEIIQQAQLIKSEAESLTQKLQKMNSSGMVSVSSTGNIITDIEETLTKLGQLIDAAKNLADNTSSQVTQTSETVRTSIASLTTTMQAELIKLNDQLTKLIGSVNETVQSTNQTVQTVNTTIQHIDVQTTKTIGFISSLGGRVSSSYYIKKKILDSSIDAVLWKENNSQYSYLRLTLDGVDNKTKLFSGTLGTTRGIFSLGAGYIQQGFGLDVGLNEYGNSGFGSRISLYRVRDLGMNSEIGYRLGILKGTRVFVFGEDLLKSERSLGGGLCYERKF